MVVIKKLFSVVGQYHDKKRPAHLTTLISFSFVFALEKVKAPYPILFVDSVTNVSPFDTGGQFGHLLISREGLDKRKPTKPYFLLSIQCFLFLSPSPFIPFEVTLLSSWP